MTIKLINAPSPEPIILADLKLALRVDTDDLDTELDAALSAARGEAEHFAGRSFAPQRWQLTRDDWWIGGLRLPRGPVDDVVDVQFLDRDGVWQTLSVLAYSLDQDFLFADPTFDFPDLLRRDSVVRIVYDAGTWTPPLPDDVQRGIMMLAQSKVDALSDTPGMLRERAFALLRPYRYDSGFRAA